MAKTIKKRGQKLIKRFSRISQKVEEGSREHIKENFIGRISHIQNIRILIFEWVLLISALIMFAITQAIWFNDSYSNNIFTDGGTYIEGTIGKVTSLNPLFATTESEKTLSKLLFATITINDYSGHSGLGLAQSISSSNSGKTWSIKLRDNLYWSDGQPLTNADVLFTFSLIQNPAVTTIFDSNLSSVKISENENNEIILNLPSAYADFSSALNIPVLPKHVLENVDPKTLIEDTFSINPITSGAFKFNALQIVSAEDDEHIFYLSANPYYYKSTPMISSFAVHTFQNEDTLINALNSGKITATVQITPENYDKVTSTNIYSKKSLINSGVYAFLNTTKTPLDNVKVRKAIKQGISLNSIRATVSEEIPLDYPLLESQIKLADYPTPIVEDYETAKNALDSIFGEEKPTLKIVTIGRGNFPNLASSLAQNLEALGFKTEISVSNESQDFLKTVVAERNYDILIYEINLGVDPDIMAYYHSSQASSTGLNLSNYKNLFVDDLILSARENPDSTVRASRYEYILKYWTDEVPAIGIHQSSINYFYNKNTRTYSDENRLVSPIDRFADVEFWSAKKEQKNRTP